MAFAAGESGSEMVTGVPVSPCSRSFGSRGMEPSNLTPESVSCVRRSATCSPPPSPKIFMTVPSGMVMPAMFSMTQAIFWSVCCAIVPAR